MLARTSTTTTARTMRNPIMEFVVVESTGSPGLSVRLHAGDKTASQFKRNLSEAGFVVGDMVKMTLVTKKRVAAGRTRRA